MRTDARIKNFLKKSRGRGDYPIGILEGWNAEIMGLDFYFGLQIAECGIENSKSTTRNLKFVSRPSSNYLSASWSLLHHPSWSWD